MSESDPCRRYIVHSAVIEICKRTGYHSVNQSCLQTLTDVMHYYMRTMSLSLGKIAGHAGRDRPNLCDAVFAMKEAKVTAEGLEDYMKNVKPFKLLYEVPKFPIPCKSDLNFLKPGSREVVTRPVHIHEHLPPMYPDLSDDHEDEAGGQAADAVMEPERRVKSQEGARKMTSVIMTSSGFLSHTREGRLPDSKMPNLKMFSNSYSDSKGEKKKAKQDPVKAEAESGEKVKKDHLKEAVKEHHHHHRHHKHHHSKIRDESADKKHRKKSPEPQVAPAPLEKPAVKLESRIVPLVESRPKKYTLTSPKKVLVKNNASHKKIKSTKVVVPAPPPPPEPIPEPPPLVVKKKVGRPRKRPLSPIIPIIPKVDVQEEIEREVVRDVSPPAKKLKIQPTPLLPLFMPSMLPSSPLIPLSLTGNPFGLPYGGGGCSGSGLDKDSPHPAMPNLPLPPPNFAHSVEVDEAVGCGVEPAENEVGIGDGGGLSIDKKAKKKMKKDKKERKKKKEKKKEKRAKEREKSRGKYGGEETLKLKLRLGSSPAPSPPKIVIKPVMKQIEMQEEEIVTASIKPISTCSKASLETGGSGGASFQIRKEKEKKKKSRKSEEEGKRDAFYYDEDGNQVWICPSCGCTDDGSPMIGCDGCDAWYHWLCIGINSAPETAKWYCPSCHD